MNVGLNVLAVYALVIGKINGSINYIPDAQIVKVQFDQVSSEDWSNHVLLEFQNIMANVTGISCQNNPAICGMTKYSSFDADDVRILVGSPSFQDVNSIMRFYIDLPPSTVSNPSIAMVPGNQLADIVKRNRLAIQTHLLNIANEDYDASFRISYVNDGLVLPQSDQRLNTIITPLAVAVVIILVLIVIGLEVRKHYRRKRKLKEVRESKFQGNKTIEDHPVTVGVSA